MYIMHITMHMPVCITIYYTGSTELLTTGTDSVPAHRKLITLSSLGNKKDDSANKRTRTSAEQPNVHEQPASKKPLQNSDPIPVRQQSSEIVADKRIRNQEKEEATQEEVRRSAQNVRWTKGPLPSNIDHWFYDLRQAGTVPPASLVAASRNMVSTPARTALYCYYSSSTVTF